MRRDRTDRRQRLTAFTGDERGDAIGIGRLFLSLFVGAVVVFLIRRITAPLFDKAGEQGSGQVATDGTTYLQQYGEFVPVMFLLIAFFGLIAYSVFRREVIR